MNRRENCSARTPIPDPTEDDFSAIQNLQDLLAGRKKMNNPRCPKPFFSDPSETHSHIHTYIHTYIHPCVHPSTHRCSPFSHSKFFGSTIQEFLLIYLPIYLFTCIACFEIFECGCACKQDKHCYIPLLRKWYDQIQKGEKQFEMRAASPYWQSRVHGATHVVFSNGSLLECMHEQSVFRLALAVF